MSEQNDNHLNRRKFLASVGVLGAAAGIGSLPVYANQQADERESGPVMKCSPYLQGIFHDRMVIRWITNCKCYSWVEYGESREQLNKKAHQIIEGMVQANNTIHDITIHGLTPGKTYYYKVVSKKIEKFTAGKVTYAETESSEIYSFTTQPLKKEVVQFSVMNDVHERPETFPHMYQYIQKGSTDFVLLNGDMFNSLRNGESQILENLLNPLNKLFSSTVPFVFTRGNHEARGEYARQLPDYLNGKQNKFYYSFELGPMYVIILDSGEDKEDDHPAYAGIISFDEYRFQQQNWLEEEMRKKAFKNAKYRVVFSHIPPFYTSKKEAHGTAFVGKHWVPVLNKAKIDVLFSGHTHRFGIHPPVKGLHDFPIIIGGGPNDGMRTIINARVDHHEMNINMIDDSGKTVGSLTI